MRPIPARLVEPVYAALRIVVGVLFASYGSQKLFGFPGGPLPGLSPLILTAGAIELAGGALVALGLLASWAAFVCSGLMAFAYFIGHAGAAFWPTVNKGDSAVVYCFVFLYLSAKGAGVFSLDALLARRARG